MMEGVSNEAALPRRASDAGQSLLDYDSNQVTIEGHTDLAFSDEVATRFRAYGWNVQHVGERQRHRKDGGSAQEDSNNPKSAPTLIIVESHIGYGAPQQATTPAPLMASRSELRR